MSRATAVVVVYTGLSRPSVNHLASVRSMLTDVVGDEICGRDRLSDSNPHMN